MKLEGNEGVGAKQQNRGITTTVQNFIDYTPAHQQGKYAQIILPTKALQAKRQFFILITPSFCGKGKTKWPHIS